MEKSRSLAWKWILRVVLGIVTALVGVVGVMFALFSSWESTHVKELETGSRIVTTALGDIEYAVVGTGVPYLMIHGTPGGYDVALAARRAMPTPPVDVMTISVSRPGYLRTPLNSGKTFEQQADLFAALLDKLTIDRAVIVASSGGGYDGLQFALRHPDRCIALVLIAPSVNYEPLPGDSANRFLLGLRDFGIWSAISSSATRNLVAGAMMKDWNRKDSEQVAFFEGVMKSIIPLGRRFEGVHNDQVQRTDPNIDHWPLDRIAVPTLLIHGTADENSDYNGSVYVASKVRGAKLVTFPGGDHFLPITHAREVRDQMRQFVTSRMMEERMLQ